MQPQPSTRLIPLTQGLFALVDEADYAAMSTHKWCASTHAGKSYAVRGVGPRAEHRMEYMHHVLCPGGRVDHINGNSLDNRRSNLRLATQQQNVHNRGKSKNNTSGYCGVIADRRRGGWIAQIKLNYKLHHLGNFSTPEDAARAYDAAARRLHGEFAKVNFS